MSNAEKDHSLKINFSQSKIERLNAMGTRRIEQSLLSHPQLNIVDLKLDYVRKALGLTDEEIKNLFEKDVVNEAFTLSNVLQGIIVPEAIPAFVRRREDPDLGGANALEHVLAGNGITLIGMYVDSFEGDLMGK